jgi:hypothetical protein
VRGKGAKLCEGCPKVRLGQDRLPNRAHLADFRHRSRNRLGVAEIRAINLPGP